MKAISVMCIVLFAQIAGPAYAELCGGPLGDNNFGRPLDYTSDRDKYGSDGGQKNKLELVEKFHFNRDVETLNSGMQGPLPGDIHYTLKHFPNHYRALHAMARWHLKNPNPDDEICDCIEWLLPAECYFTRAITFTPADPVLFYIMGIYLHKNDELEKSRGAYENAVELGLDSAELHYNMGLLLVDLKDYSSAREQARLAYEKGAPFPGLRRKLERIDEW